MQIKRWLFGPSKKERARAEHIEASVVSNALRASAEDLRDIVFVPRVDPTKIARVDRAEIFPRVEDQVNGDCTGQTMTTICEAIRNTAYPYSPGESDLSQLFNYYWSRKLDGLTGDSGATPRSMCRSARNYGLPPLALHPYGKDIDRAPTQEAMDAAALAKLGRYELIEIDGDDYRNTVYRMKSAMAEGLLVALAFNARRWMFYVNGPLGSKGHTRPRPMPDRYDDIIGGHIVPLRGYDDTIFPNSGGSFIAQNSWGTDWGDQGLWSIPYTLFGGHHFPMEIRCFRSFAGIEMAPEPEIPLTLEQVQQYRAELASVGLGTTDSAGNFSFNPDPMLPYLAAWRLLDKRGCSYSDASQVVGVGADVIEGFVTSNAPKVAAWKALL